MEAGLNPEPYQPTIAWAWGVYALWLVVAAAVAITAVHRDL
jgi:hypothetical protein